MSPSRAGASPYSQAIHLGGEGAADAPYERASSHSGRISMSQTQPGGEAVSGAAPLP